MSKKAAERSRTERAQQALIDQAARERRRNLVLVAAVVAVLAVVVGAGYLLTRGGDTTGRVPAAVPAGTEDYAVLVGDADAPSTITVYEDLQCPVCAQFESVTGDQVQAAVEAGDVNVEYRMVSFLDEASTNEYSSRALNAAMVVLDTAGEEAFVDFKKQLFADQPAEGGAGFSDDELVQYAVEAGASEDEVRGPIEDERFAQWVVNATDQMSRDGVNGTPTVLIDGESAGSDPGESAQAVLELVG